MSESPGNWLDRAIGFISPARQLNRARARAALRVLASHYDAAQSSRRTLGWKRPTGDANASLSDLSLVNLRNSSRHLVRNNGHATNALQTIVDDTIGWGITPTEQIPAFEAWAKTTAIDADGRCNLAGLEHQAMRTVVEAGEVLLRRRFRRPSDGLPLPLQIQVLEPDFIDTSKHGIGENGRRIVRGVEFDAIGRRSAYWLFKEHPGTTSISGTFRFGQSERVPASEIIHVFRPERPGQVRGAPWFAPVLLRFNDFDEFADATLMKQKISACLTVLTTDVTGETQAIGTENTDDETIDMLEPGWIGNLDPGKTIEIVNPPSVREYPDYVQVTLREIAAGIGVTPEDLTGHYGDMNFSSARMSRLRHWARVEGWRWRMLEPQMLAPLWNWAWQAAMLSDIDMPQTTMWTAPGMPWIEPDKEATAIGQLVRSGLSTLSEELRRRGLHVTRHWDEYQADMEDLDDRALIIDTDPRKMTQQGQRHSDTQPGRPAESGTSAALVEFGRLLAELPEDEAEAFMANLFASNGGNGNGIGVR